MVTEALLTEVLVWPGGVNMISMLKTPASLDERMTSTLSNCVGENWSMDRRLPREYCKTVGQVSVCHRHG